MKIALGQINTTVGDFSGNSRKIIDFSRRAKDSGAELVLFPELSICGYPARDMVERPSFVQKNQETAELIARETTGIAVICGLVTPAHADTGKAVMNSAAFLNRGKVQSIQSKMLLPTYDVFDEQRNFAPAKEQHVVSLDGKKLALTICEDVWNDKNFWSRRLYSFDPVEELVKQGGELILNISSSPFQSGKLQTREEMLSAIAKHHCKPVLYVNQVGGNDSIVFDGSSLVLDGQGNIVARGRSFEEDLIFYDTDTNRGDLHPQTSARDAAVYRALVLGTCDYIKKCGFSKALIGLSGGIDSALVAAIAVDALGAENVIGVGMPTDYSSQGSVDDAKALAKNLGIRFELIPIQAMFQEFKKTMAPIFVGRKEDVTEENMQARIRGNILMAMSNKLNALVLSTGNKSEYAVGYATLYGDMAGALAVISDVPKTMVYQLCEYRNTQSAVVPRSTIEKPPSAELRPDQKDTDSLPPYDVLDVILEEYVEDLKTVQEIAQGHRFDEQLVSRVAKMIERSEYKRQQAPPGLKISEKAFGVGRRFPIAVKYEV